VLPGCEAVFGLFFYFFRIQLLPRFEKNTIFALRNNKVTYSTLKRGDFSIMVSKQKNERPCRSTAWSLHPLIFQALVAGVVLLAACTVVDARTLICESMGGKPQFCPTDTRGGVRLSRQFSKSGCYEGETWGYDRYGIWVDRGCRAKFEIGDYRPDRYGGGHYDRRYTPRDDYQRRRTPQTIICESLGNRQNYCRAPLHRGQVNIVRQLSKTQCRYGDNWGWDRGGIWVRGGCRAVFSIQ
jgi:hypothetical protein